MKGSFRQDLPTDLTIDDGIVAGDGGGGRGIERLGERGGVGGVSEGVGISGGVGVRRGVKGTIRGGGKGSMVGGDGGMEGVNGARGSMRGEEGVRGGRGDPRDLSAPHSFRHFASEAAVDSSKLPEPFPPSWGRLNGSEWLSFFLKINETASENVSHF